MAARDPGLGDALPALLSTLGTHGLVRRVQSPTPWQGAIAAYNVTAAGMSLLERLAAEGSDSERIAAADHA
jgi:DNA-binding HxlR family transcriptional regulator